MPRSGYVNHLYNVRPMENVNSSTCDKRAMLVAGAPTINVSLTKAQRRQLYFADDNSPGLHILSLHLHTLCLLHEFSK